MRATFALALLVLAGNLRAAQQSPASPARERVGVVLSSGGAHALAQIGVLAALEELHVPVDLLVGSEGGALVAGLYASGMSAAEMQALISDREWGDALNGSIARPLLSWRQRTVDHDFLLALPVSFGPGRMGLARGLVRTRWLSWLLSATTLRVSGVRDFDDLPVALRIAATDLLAGDAVTLDDGNLSAAMLASFATPGLHAPVEIGGRELGSGALSDPIPVRAALDAGCTVVVLVDCALAAAHPERLDSFLSANAHVGVLAGERARRSALALLRPADIIVAPNLGGAGEEDYRSAQELFERGRTAVGSCGAELEKLALDPIAWAEHLAQREARRPPLPRLGTLRIEDSSGLGDSVLLSRIESEPGERLSQQRVSRDVLRLYGLDYHERIDIELRPSDEELADLVVHAHSASEYAWNPRAGAALEGVFGEDATYVMGASATFRPIDGLGAEWRNRIEVGSRILLFSEFWQPIDPSARWFIAPALAYEQERVNITADEDVLASYDVWAVGGRFDAGRVLGEWGEVRLGLVKQAGSASLAVGDPAAFDSFDFDQGFFEATLTVDTVDSLSLPSEGSLGRVLVTAPAEWMGGDQESYLRSQFDKALTWNRTTLTLGAEFDTALDDQDALQNAFPLGGFLRLSGLGRDSVSGAHVGLARAVTWTELGRHGMDYRSLRFNLGASLEAGQTWSDRDDISASDLRYSGSLFVAVQTIFGPIFLGFGLTEPGETAIFLVFGNVFGNWNPF